MVETATDRPEVQRFELGFQKGCSKPPWHRQGPTATPEGRKEAPMPIHRIVPTILLHGPHKAQLWPGLQLRLCSPDPSYNPQSRTPSPSPAQPQTLPLATQLSQILKRTLLKLQYILFLASKYPSVSTYSWLSSAILQPPALNLSVLDFLLDSYKRKKNFQMPQAWL